MSSDNEKGSKTRKHAKLSKEDAEDESVFFIPKKGDSSKLRKVNSSKEPTIQKYLSMTKDELQKWLRHNAQLVTGRKNELLRRCVDGQVNGRIPGCPRCHHGQMQYDYQNREYICNGYFDDMSRVPIRCGHTEPEVKREKWHDLEKDAPVQRTENEKSKEGDSAKSSEKTSESAHHKDHPDHRHNEHHCKVEANHAIVDILEDMAFYHSVLRDENWGYKSRAFITAARAVEDLDFEIKEAKSLGDSSSENHVERIGKSSAEIIQSFLDSGKKNCPPLDELRSKVEGSESEER